MISVVDIDAVAEEFTRVKIEADKRKALAAMKETGVVPAGFDFKRGDPHIRITLR